MDAVREMRACVRPGGHTNEQYTAATAIKLRGSAMRHLHRTTTPRLTQTRTSCHEKNNKTFAETDEYQLLTQTDPRDAIIIIVQSWTFECDQPVTIANCSHSQRQIDDCRLFVAFGDGKRAMAKFSQSRVRG